MYLAKHAYSRKIINVYKHADDIHTYIHRESPILLYKSLLSKLSDIMTHDVDSDYRCLKEKLGKCQQRKEGRGY